MAEYRENLNGWAEVYNYLTRLYKQREQKYIQSSEVSKPDVIIPRSNVPNAGSRGYFQRTNRSFDLGAEYNMRHKTSQCSLQVRKYDNGEKLYNSIHKNNNIFLGTTIPKDLANIKRELYYVQLNWKNPDATQHEDITNSVRALVGHLFLDVIGHNPGDFFTQYCSRDMNKW
jgi:hypothetical protein